MMASQHEIAEWRESHPEATRYCFMCWHGSCESCDPTSCDCLCCPTSPEAVLELVRGWVARAPCGDCDHDNHEGAICIVVVDRHSASQGDGEGECMCGASEADYRRWSLS
jgi:hypothetical protein